MECLAGRERLCEKALVIKRRAGALANLPIRGKVVSETYGMWLTARFDTGHSNPSGNKSRQSSSARC
jgi:hypothetical protein